MAFSFPGTLLRERIIGIMRSRTAVVWTAFVIGLASIKQVVGGQVTGFGDQEHLINVPVAVSAWSSAIVILD